MSERSQVYSSCFCRQRVESACGSAVTARPASITEWTSKSVPYASKRYPAGNVRRLARGRGGGAVVRRGGPRATLARTARRRGTPRRLGQRREARLVKAVLEQRARVAEREAAGVRAEHDQQE